MVELEGGDLLQASEKLWGAAAQALKSVAEHRGLQHNSHAQFYNIMAILEGDANMSNLRVGFDAASQLHINFYENWLDEDQIRRRAADVLHFIEQLNRLD
jgi:hypothetical protein